MHVHLSVHKLRKYIRLNLLCPCRTAEISRDSNRGLQTANEFLLKTAKSPQVVHFRKNYHWWFVIKHDVSTIIKTFLLMHPLELYYRRQAGGGSETGIGPIHSTPYLQRAHGIGDFLAVYFAGYGPEFGAGSKLSDFMNRREHFIWQCRK